MTTSSAHGCITCPICGRACPICGSCNCPGELPKPLLRVCGSCESKDKEIAELKARVEAATKVGYDCVHKNIHATCIHCSLRMSEDIRTQHFDQVAALTKRLEEAEKERENAKFMRRIAEVAAEEAIEQLQRSHEALDDAIKTLEDWICYVPDYFVKKHKYEDDVKRLKAAMEQEESN